MDPETWSKVKEILDTCLDLEPALCSRYLDEACAGDPQIRTEVESLLTAHQQAGDFIAHPVLRESFAGLRLGHWKIVADIGEGGMSRVCLAERDDGQFQQRAAVKILKRGMDTDLILRHFQMERQILAGMRHPNVARLLDGGVTPGGRPYFVMEHIDGVPLDEYAEAKKLGASERLRLFQQVCAAVHYAHQRLVVHRDIKPSNILVTPEGTAKLLDFGIATIVSPEPALGTLTAAQMLTPDFASPEQIRGEPVTTASDVYSLGVLLYRLLSGRNPYRSPTTARELVRAICEEEPAAPGLSGDLDNIVLKALEKDPQRRYSSAEQFSQDIERHLEGRPVLARPHTWSYRTSKFVTRNKLGVTAAGLMLVLLAGGIAATLWQARIARIERRLADERFFDTRQLANSLLFELHDAIQDLPGATAARALIIQRSLKYLDRISAAAPGNSALQLEAAEGYMRLGDVQGKPGNANLGKYAAARESYQKAVALLQQPVRDPAIDRRRSRLLARALIRVGGYPETLQALQILEALRQADAHDSTTLTDLATGDGAMSDLLRQKRELQQALEFRLKEWTLRKQILDADARNLTSTRNFALSSKRMGGLLWAMNRGPEGMDYYQMALRLEEQWAALDPASADARTAISYSHSDIGFLLAGDQKFAEALAHYRKTVSIREELAALDPNNARATLGLASAYWRTARISISAGNIQNALDLLNKAVKTLSQAKNPDPSSNRSRTELAHIYHVYGESHAGLGDTVAAREWYGRSRQILDGFRAAGTLDVDDADLLKDVEKQLKSSKLR